jgi:hypothetical protein
MKLIPTMNLRIVLRSREIGHQGDNVINEMMPVLQQQFDLSRGGSVWRDVPVIVEEEISP